MSEKKYPLVSVVMPVYNQELYVGKAIESILGQTFRNFEFIIIDDGSTDRTWDIIKSYQDDRIIIFKNEINLGNYPARNRGIKASEGKYIAVMDGDDVSMRKRLEIQIKIMEEDPSLLAHGTAYVLSNGKRGVKPADYEYIKAFLLYNNSFLHPSLMIRKDVLLTIGCYDEKYRYSSDYDLVCRISKKGKMINISDVLIQYRLGKSQISSSQWLKQKEYADEIRLKYLKSCGFRLSEKEIQKFTFMMTNPGRIYDLEYVALINKIREQNQRLNYFAPSAFERLFEFIVSGK